MAPFSLSQLWSKKIGELRLSEIQGLTNKTILNLVSRQFPDQNNIKEPFEDNKKLVALIDSYLMWAISHKEDFEFQDAKTLLTSIPYRGRDDCATLYSVVDSLLERYPNVSENDRTHLCNYFYPF